MLTKLKMILGVTDKDELIQYCIDKATEDVVDYTNQKLEYCLEHLENSIIEIAIIRYNRMGTEGLQSESYSGISNTFLDDLPKSEKRRLRSHRKLSRGGA